MTIYLPDYRNDPRLVAYSSGILPSRATDDALMAAWKANNYFPLAGAAILAITGPAPAYPVSLPRDPDSNPDPFDSYRYVV